MLPCAPNNFIVVIVQNTQEKADLQKMKVSATKIRKVRADGNKLRTGKEWRLYADENLAVSKNFKIRQLLF